MKAGALAGLALSHAAAVGIGYAVTDKEPVNTVVKQDGFFKVDAGRVLATTVESLREENKLQVFSAKVGAQVVMDRSRFYFLGLHQKLTVPAVVSYHIDLSQLSLADVVFEERAKLVRVRLPKLKLGDVVFSPEQSAEVNAGLLSLSEEQVEEVRKANYAQARRAVVAQAQQPALVNAAKRQAITDIESFFEIPLRIAGLPDVKVVASFEP